MDTIKRYQMNGRMSRAVSYGGLVFVGGQTAVDRSQDVCGQTEQVLEKLDKLLAEAGTDKSRILFAQIWLKDIGRDFAGMNKAWDAWVSPDATPARATAECPMASPEILVEIVVTAAI